MIQARDADARHDVEGAVSGLPFVAIAVQADGFGEAFHSRYPNTKLLYACKAFINVALAKLLSIVKAMGGRAIICMFGTGKLATHATGRVDSVPEAVEAWTKVHKPPPDPHPGGGDPNSYLGRGAPAGI